MSCSLDVKMKIVERMVSETLDAGSIPYMLIVPQGIYRYVSAEYPQVYVTIGKGDEILCIPAEYENFRDGALVMH